MTTGYEPRFDIDYERGRQGELIVNGALSALRSGDARVEVKTDERFATTGRLYIEYACRRRDGWNASGVLTTESEFWAYVVSGGAGIIVLSTDLLRAWVDRCRTMRHGLAEETDGSHPTKGALLTTNQLMAWLKARDARL